MELPRVLNFESSFCFYFLGGDLMRFAIELFRVLDFDP